MDEGKAYEIAREMGQAEEGTIGPTQVSSRLADSLARLIPDGDVSSAQVTQDGQPTVVVLQENRLFFVSASADDVVQCQMVTLDPTRATLTVKEDWFHEIEGPKEISAVRRSWRLEVEDTVVEVAGLDHRVGFSKGPDDGEALGRALADSLGWILPAQ